MPPSYASQRGAPTTPFNCPSMAQAEGWERLGELSRLLQSYRHMYVRREVEEDNPSVLNWRHELVEFLKVRAEPGGRRWCAVWPPRTARRLGTWVNIM